MEMDAECIKIIETKAVLKNGDYIQYGIITWLWNAISMLCFLIVIPFPIYFKQQLWCSAFLNNQTIIINLNKLGLWYWEQWKLWQVTVSALSLLNKRD